MRKLLLLIVLAFTAQGSLAQDTLRVMHYNLLQFGATQQFCNVACKEGHLKTILAEARPQIFVVNELTNNAVYAQRILVNVLNTDGVTSWQRATYINTNNSNVVSMLYFDSNLLGLKTQHTVTTGIRDILVYDLYYRSADLATGGDTVFIRVISAHLKAGSTASDEADRTAMANALMTWLGQNNTIPNVLMTGDFNTGTSSEDAYQAFVANANASIRFYDPLNAPGNWGSNSIYAFTHTQSTRINAENDGGSSGGLDDRFDFILAGVSMQNASSTVKYVPDTYTAMGNDGNTHNEAITSSSALTPALRTSLYMCSDHLPVYADFAFDVTVVGNRDVFSQNVNTLELRGNPVSHTLTFTALPTPVAQCQVVDVAGRVVLSPSNSDASLGSIGVNELPAGAYWLQVTDANGRRFGARFIKI